jgi:gliding motility-associated-like protein
MKKNSTQRLLFALFFFSLFFGTNLDAQVGREFWFVAPEVTGDHGDSPVFFRITALDNKADVKIYLGEDETLIWEKTVKANSQEKYEVDVDIENKPATIAGLDNPLNKGIHIVSSEDITVYYEVVGKIGNGEAKNPDKFTLKGDNALGTEFFVPSQNTYYNHFEDWWSDPARERIDIVATEDGTEIEIVPTDTVIGYDPGETISVTLNRGQTYSVWAKSERSENHLGGTHITSNKPVAVTVSDDSIQKKNEYSYDLIGDQIVPIDVIGTEYIAINTMYGQKEKDDDDNEEQIKSAQKIYIVTTQDETTIWIGENAAQKYDKGELISTDITDNATYIKSDKPIYVYQVTGVPEEGDPTTTDFELGSALLPPVTCTGSTSVSFTKVLDARFWVQIITKAPYQKYFDLIHKNENNTIITEKLDDNNDVEWTPVPGTPVPGPDWVTTVIKMDSVSTGTPYTLNNDSSLFHMSILEENGSSMSYGYFSSYSSLRIQEPDIFCESEGNVVLRTQETMNDYRWVYYENEYTTVDMGTADTLVVEKPGTYGLSAKSSLDPQCVMEDAVEILSATPVFSIEGDTVVCPGEPLTFTASPADTYDYVWPDNITGNSYTITNGLMPDEDIEITLSATYNITNTDQCVKNETQSITARSVPKVNWSVAGQEICLGDTLKAVVTSGEELIVEYQWSVDGTLVPNHNEPYIVPTQSGADYSLTVITEDNCDVDKTINLTVHALPDANIADAAVCPGDDHTFTLTNVNDYTYLWQGESKANTLNDGNGRDYDLTMSTTDSIYVEVTDPTTRCVARDSAFFEVWNEQAFEKKDTSVCLNNPLEIEIDPNFLFYNWSFTPDGGSTTGISPEPASPHIYRIDNATFDQTGTYYIEAEDNNGCEVLDTFYLEVQAMPAIAIDRETDFCKADGDGNRIDIGIEDHDYEDFIWVNMNDPSTMINDSIKESVLHVKEEGTYQLTAIQSNGCYNKVTTTVTTWPSPTFDIPNKELCPNEDVSLSLDIEEHNWDSPQNQPDDAPRKHTWFKLNEDGKYELYYEGADLGGAQDGNPEAGVYSLEVSDAICKFSDRLEISYHELTEIELEDDEFCDNESYTLQIPEALAPPVTNTYHWSQDGTSNQGAEEKSWTVNNDGDYTLHIVDQNNCTNQETLTLSHLPAPKFVLGADDDKCLGDTLMVMTEPTFNRYEWNKNTAPGQTNVYTTTASGYDLNFSLQIWDKNGCTATETASVDVFALPEVDLGPDQEECPGHEITLSVDPFKEIYWTTREQNVTSVTVANGKHKVKVVDDNGCTSMDSMTFIWRNSPRIDLGPDLYICPVDYPERALIEAPEGYYDYTWHNGQQGRFITANLMDTLNTVSVIDDNGCIGWDTKVVDILGYPGYKLGSDTTACDSDDLIINAGAERISKYAGEETITPFIDYQWNTGNNERTQEITEPGNYWVEVFDGCFFLRDTIHVEYYPTPEITRLDTTYYAQVSVLADNGTRPYQFALDDEDRLQDNNTFKKIENGEHAVYVEDKNGCMAYTIFMLNSTYDIDIPNFFTPNNDGFNDTWQIEGLERLPDSEVSIFDRYGKLLRKFKASESISWDGEYQNKPVPSDDYWYVIYLQPVEKLIKGNVTIKR